MMNYKEVLKRAGMPEDEIPEIPDEMLSTMRRNAATFGDADLFDVQQLAWAIGYLNGAADANKKHTDVVRKILCGMK